VKIVYRFSIWSAEGNMAAGEDRLSEADPKERLPVRSIASEELAFRIQSFDADGTKRLVEERSRSLHIANANCHVI